MRGISTLQEGIEEGYICVYMGASFILDVPMPCTYHCFQTQEMAVDVSVDNG